MIVPGKMTPDDIAAMVMTVMDSQFKETLAEYDADILVTDQIGQGRSGLIDLSSLKEDVDDDLEWARSQAPASPEEARDVQSTLLHRIHRLHSLADGLQAFPQKQTEMFEAYVPIYHEKPSWKKVAEQDIVELGKRVAEAEQELKEKLKELEAKFKLPLVLPGTGA
jgi:hypothetical protein